MTLPKPDFTVMLKTTTQSRQTSRQIEQNIRQVLYTGSNIQTEQCISSSHLLLVNLMCARPAGESGEVGSHCYVALRQIQRPWMRRGHKHGSTDMTGCVQRLRVAKLSFIVNSARKPRWQDGNICSINLTYQHSDNGISVTTQN
jgi:hypothetical protein